MIGAIVATAARSEMVPRFFGIQSNAVREKTLHTFDIVTDADEAAEREIAAGLTKAFPSALIIGEEGAHAGQESQLSFHVSRGGQPALDMIPFLRVAALAVFIDSADLAYVHVHAAPAAAPKIGSTGASMPHDLTGKTPANPGALGHADAPALTCHPT